MMVAWITPWIFDLMRFPKTILTVPLMERGHLCPRVPMTGKKHADKGVRAPSVGFSASLRLCGKLFSLVIALVIPMLSMAQAPLNDLIFTIGTTVQASGGQDWSYVLVGAVDPALLRGKQFAVYGKAGLPVSASP